MKRLILLLGTVSSINVFAVTGWTTTINNDSDLQLNTLYTPGSNNNTHWNAGDLTESIVIPAHSKKIFYTEEVSTIGQKMNDTRYGTTTKYLNYSFYNNIVNINVGYTATPDKNNNEYAGVVIGDNQTVTTNGTYNAPTGCVGIVMTMSQDNILTLNSLNYGDHKDC